MQTFLIYRAYIKAIHFQHAIAFALLITFAGPSFAGVGDAITVTGVGTAIGLGPAARSKAIEDAQAAIVLERLERIAPSRDFSIFTSLLRSSSSFFESSKTVKETKTEDSTHVEIEGQLLERKLKEQIAEVALGQHFVTPRIVILASEQLAPDAQPDLSKQGIIEKKLYDDLKRIQFEIVAPEQSRERIPTVKWGECIDGSPELGAILARDMLADIVVLGSGKAVVEEERRGVNRVRADVSLCIVRTDDGYVLDTPKAYAIVNSADPIEGAKQAIEDACAKLVGETKTAVALGALGGTPIDALLVTIDGVSNDTQSDAILNAFQTCLGIEKPEIIYSGNNRVRARVAYAGPINAFIDCVDGMARSKDAVALKSVIGRDVTLTVGAPNPL